MGHGKETPRQKMIGMMYLFYTALLALNVSAEVLSAFELVDKSLRNTNLNTEGIIDQNISEFAKAAELQKGNPVVEKWKNYADEVKANADRAYDLIQYYKGYLVTTLEGTTDATADTAAENSYAELIKLYAANNELEDPSGLISANPDAIKKFGPVGSFCVEEMVTKKDDNNVGGQIFITNAKSKNIENELRSLREYFCQLVEKDTISTAANKASKESLIANIRSTLNVDQKQASSNGEGDSIPWNVANFEHLPAAGVITLMTKMQSDVRNLEASMLSFCLGQIGKSDMKFNAIKAVVNAPSSYVLVGQPYKAEVFIAAYDSTENPEILVGGSPITVQNGVGTYTGNTSSVGPKSWGGVIKLKNKSTGEIKEYPFKGEYEVGQSSVSVSPTKMNVFYVGVPNPVEVTASGIPAEKLHVGISSGSITKSGNGYVVNVKSPGTVKVNVSATVDGQTKTFPAKEFRVKTVPDPVACIGSDPANKRGGIISKAVLAAQSGVKAELENFDFDMKFQVTGFNVSATVKGFSQDVKCQGSQISGQAKALIQSLAPGSKVYFEDINAKGPDGSVRKLGSLSFKLK